MSPGKKTSTVQGNQFAIFTWSLPSLDLCLSVSLSLARSPFVALSPFGSPFHIKVRIYWLCAERNASKRLQTNRPNLIIGKCIIDCHRYLYMIWTSTHHQQHHQTLQQHPSGYYSAKFPFRTQLVTSLMCLAYTCIVEARRVRCVSVCVCHRCLNCLSFSSICFAFLYRVWLPVFPPQSDADKRKWYTVCPFVWYVIFICSILRIRTVR